MYKHKTHNHLQQPASPRAPHGQEPRREARACMESRCLPLRGRRSPPAWQSSPGLSKSWAPCPTPLPSLHGSHHTSGSTVFEWETETPPFLPKSLPQAFGVFLNPPCKCKVVVSTTELWLGSSEGGILSRNNCRVCFWLSPVALPTGYRRLLAQPLTNSGKLISSMSQ